MHTYQLLQGHKLNLIVHVEWNSRSFFYERICRNIRYPKAKAKAKKTVP